MNRVKHGEDVGGAAAGNEPEAAEIAHSAIVILVPEADPLVAAYRERYDPAAARSGPVPALFEPLHRWLGVLFFLIMGGAVKVRGNVGASGAGIDNNAAEWNIYVDPVAANLVLQSGAPITLVPLDAANHAPVTVKFYKRLAGDHTTPEATFAFDGLTQQKEFIDAGGYYFWDPLAAAILTDESLATFQNQGLCVVETEGPESGRTKAGEGCPEVRVALSADAGHFEQTFLEVLNFASP